MSAINRFAPEPLDALKRGRAAPFLIEHPENVCPGHFPCPSSRPWMTLIGSLLARERLIRALGAMPSTPASDGAEQPAKPRRRSRQ